MGTKYDVCPQMLKICRKKVFKKYILIGFFHDLMLKEDFLMIIN